MRRLISLSLLPLLAALGGCASLSPYSDTTKLDLKLAASEDLNPDLRGRPSPIVVRLLELKNPSSFNNADFFSLYQRPKDFKGEKGFYFELKKEKGKGKKEK